MFFIYYNIYLYLAYKLPLEVVKLIFSLGALFPELIILLRLLKS